MSGGEIGLTCFASVYLLLCVIALVLRSHTTHDRFQERVRRYLP